MLERSVSFREYRFFRKENTSSILLMKIVLRIERLTQRRSQRRLRLEFMDGLSHTMVIELADPLAGRRGSAFDR